MGGAGMGLGVEVGDTNHHTSVVGKHIPYRHSKTSKHLCINQRNDMKEDIYV